MPQFEIDIKGNGIGFVASVMAENKEDAVEKLRGFLLAHDTHQLDIEGNYVFDVVVFFYPDEFTIDDIERGFRPERET